jgi:N6-adenosine-specific RNA methylase IME4
MGAAVTATIPVTRIVVPANRMRALRPEKVAEIAESIQAGRGLLQPIVVRPRGRNSFWLVAGRHRLEAVRELGFDRIPAVIRDGLDADAALLAEIDENLIRADLSPAERAMHQVRRKDLYEKLHPETKHGGDRKSGKAKSTRQSGDKIAERFTKDAAKKTGKSERSVQRDVERADKITGLADVVGTSLDAGDELDALAKLPESAQAHLIARAKAGEKVTARDREILRKAQEIRDALTEQRRAERIAKAVELSAHNAPLPTDRKYPLILADPPWRYDFSMTATRSVERHYPTMSLEEICSLPVSDLAAPTAVLFLWVPPPILENGFAVIKAWGFSYRTSAVWAKDKIGAGHYFRQQHEHLLLATRGDMPAPPPHVRSSSIIEAPRGAHSEKPIAVLELIERMYPDLPKIELFRRGPPRKGWKAWGNESVDVSGSAAI